MNKIIIAILLLSVVSFAQSPTPSVEPSVNNTEVINQVKEVLKSQIDETKKPTGTTYAQVLDKSVDLMANYTAAIADMLSKITPELWRIMIKQQYAIAISNILYALGFPLVFGSYPFVLKKLMRKDKELPILSYEKGNTNKQEEAEIFRVITSWISFILFTLSLLIASYAIIGAIQILINPEYYAIKDIIQMVK